MTKIEQIRAERLWFEALQDTLEDGDIESAKKAIAAAIALKRREEREEK